PSGATILWVRARSSAGVSRARGRGRGRWTVCLAMWQERKKDDGMTEGRSTFRQERVQRPHELFRRLDVRRVPGRKLDHAGVQQGRRLAGRFERNGVLDAVEDQGAGSGVVRECPPDAVAQVI